jgi:trafficking protein particle complex subunit 2
MYLPALLPSFATPPLTPPSQNNPLHITLFPSYAPTPSVPYGPIRTPLQFSLLLSSSLDIFEARTHANATTGAGLSGDFGLLQALDERLALYGFETNTGVKFIAVVDLRGRKLKGVEDALLSGAGEKGGKEAGRGRGVGAGGPAAGVVGLREGEMKVVCA